MFSNKTMGVSNFTAHIESVGDALSVSFLTGNARALAAVKCGFSMIVWDLETNRRRKICMRADGLWIELGGEVGRHDWSVADCGEEGFAVFVDDRQIGAPKPYVSAVAYAKDVISRLIEDGDYRLNDKPAGFLPPPAA